MIGRILVFLGGLLVVALFSALLAPYFVDWTDFRRNFEDQASRALGKKVAVLGAVDARILPFPSVTLHDVTVGQDTDGSPLVHVERFSMDAELAPLLSGEARIFDMRIEEPKIRMRLLSDGTLGWMRGGSPEIPARTVVLEKVHVSGGTIEFIDEQTNRTRVISGLEADMSAASLAGPWIVDGRATFDGEAARFHLSTQQPSGLKAAIPMRLRVEPATRPFDLDLEGELSVDGNRPGYKGRFQAQLRPAPAVKTDQAKRNAPSVKGDFELANDRIRVPVYRLELGTADDPYAVTGEATLDTGREPQFLLTAEGQQIDVSRIVIDGSKGKTGRDASASAKARLNGLIAMASQLPIPDVPGRASLSLPAIVAGDTVIRDVRLDVRPAGTGWAVDKAVATLPGRTQVEAKGKLTLKGEPAFSGDLLVASTQPSGLAAWLSGSVDPTIRKIESAGFSALVSLTPELQRFEKLELAIGPDTLKGRVERQSFGDSRPNLSFDLAGNSVDIDAMRALATLLAGQDAGESLFSHQIGARLKVGRFSAFGTTAKDVDTVFTISDGAYSIEKLDVGDLSGAKLHVSGKAEGGLLEQSGEGDIVFNAFDPGPFLGMLRRQLGDHPLLAQLERNAAWYANSNLALRVKFGEKHGGISASLGGTANGSRINGNYSRSDFLDLMGDAAVTAAVTLENPTASTLLGQAGLSPLPFDGDGAGLLSFEVKAEGTAPAQVSMTFGTDATKFTATGALSVAADSFLDGAGQLSLESADIEPYLVMNGLPLPQPGMGLPVKLSSGFAIDGQSIVFSQLAATVADNPIEGEVAFDRRQDILKGQGHLSVGNADLGWLAENVVGPPQDMIGDLSKEPLPVIGAFGTDLMLDLKAGSFTSGIGSAMEGFSTKLTLKGGALTLDDVSARWLGGELKGRMSLADTDGTGYLQGQMTLTDGDIASLSAGQPDSGSTGTAAGRFDLTTAFESTGQSTHELVDSINGSGSLRLAGLTLSRLDLGMFGPLLAEVDAVGGEVTEEKVKAALAKLVDAHPASIGDVQVAFNVTNGVARAQNVVSQTPAARLTAEGRLNVVDSAINASITVAFNAGEEALQGAEPIFRMVYSGDTKAPQRDFDVAELTNFLSLRAFERERRRVETLQANVLEKQRLRREVALYRFEERQREEARLKAEAEERVRLEEEARLKAEEEARVKAEQEARAKADAEAAARRAAETPATPASPAPAPLPGVGVPEPRNTQSVPPVRIMPVPQRERVIRTPMPAPNIGVPSSGN